MSSKISVKQQVKPSGEDLLKDIKLKKHLEFKWKSFRIPAVFIRVRLLKKE